MNKSKIMLSALTLLIVASCKKTIDQPIEPPLPKTCKITEISRSGSPTTYLTYNSDGKLSRIDNGSKVSNDFETLTYSNDKIMNYFEYPTGSSTKVTGTVEYTLDAGGRIATVKGYNGNITTFTYDSNGYLIQGVTAYMGGTSTLSYTWTNGNLTKITEPNGTITTITYGTETSSNDLLKTLLLPNNYSNYTGFDISMLAMYMGKTSNNLAATSTQVYTTGTYKNTYTYTKDSDGKVTKVVNTWDYVTTGGTTSNKNTVEFTYSCN